MIAELSKVVDKFNGMLSELVSQSFIDLKESTIRLNEWQISYKDTIEKHNTDLTNTL